MKSKQKQSLKNATRKELDAKLVNLSQDMVVAHNQAQLGKLKNIKTMKNLRYEIAFIKTLITEKQLANQEEKSV